MPRWQCCWSHRIDQLAAYRIVGRCRLVFGGAVFAIATAYFARVDKSLGELSQQSADFLIPAVNLGLVIEITQRLQKSAAGDSGNAKCSDRIVDGPNRRIKPTGGVQCRCRRLLRETVQLEDSDGTIEGA